MKWQYLTLVLLVVVLAGCLDGSPEPLPPEMREGASDQSANVEPEAAHIEPETSNVPPAVPNDREVTPSPDEKEQAVTQPQAPEAESKPLVRAKPPVVEPARQPRTVARPRTRQSEEDEQWATPDDLGGPSKKAGVGMGRKGHGYGNDMVTYPLATYFRIREKISLQLMQNAMQKYKALNGHYPRTQDEFRKEIIKANRIKMAVLPSGRKYFYDPDEGKLLVIGVP